MKVHVSSVIMSMLAMAGSALALPTAPSVEAAKPIAKAANLQGMDKANTLGNSAIMADADKRVAQLNEWENHIQTFIKGLKGAPAEPLNVSAIMAMCEEYLKKPDLIPELRQKIVGVIADGYGLQRNVPMVYAMMHRALNEDPESTSEEAEKLRQTIQHYDEFLLPDMKLVEEAQKAAAPYMKKK